MVVLLENLDDRLQDWRTNMDFSEALKKLKNGEKICRKSWDENSLMYLHNNKLTYQSKYVISTEDNVIGAEDVLANDWCVVIELPRVGDIIKLKCGQNGIVLKTRLDGGYCALLDDGTTHVYYSFDFQKTGKNYKEIVDDLLKVLA